jgi:hypothetical protein
MEQLEAHEIYGEVEIRVYVQFHAFITSVLLTVTGQLPAPSSMYINPLTPELNPSAQRCLRRFLMGILILEPCI